MSTVEFHAIETASRLGMENERLRREAYKNTNVLIEKNALIYELQDQLSAERDKSRGKLQRLRKALQNLLNVSSRDDYITDAAGDALRD